MYMEEGIKRAMDTMKKGYGGPFGAVVVKNGEIISVASNTVLLHHDPTAHAEVNAIRDASYKLGTHNLEGCVLYATGYPCPMCLSAIIWSNIKEVYYGCTKEDAGNIGFRDDLIYEYLKGNNLNLLNLQPLDRLDCIRLFEDYKKNNKIIY